MNEVPHKVLFPAMRVDVSHYTHPIKSEVNNALQILAMFDNISYMKGEGALVLKAVVVMQFIVMVFFPNMIFLFVCFVCCYWRLLSVVEIHRYMTALICNNFTFLERSPADDRVFCGCPVNTCSGVKVIQRTTVFSVEFYSFTRLHQFLHSFYKTLRLLFNPSASCFLSVQTYLCQDSLSICVRV